MTAEIATTYGYSTTKAAHTNAYLWLPVARELAEPETIGQNQEARFQSRVWKRNFAHACAVSFYLVNCTAIDFVLD
jgi:hypothetical protein